MEKASQNLMSDHRDISLTLNILEKICNLLKTNREADLVDITRLIYFIKIFADECHHGKEEKLLLPAINEVAVRRQRELIEELLTEHVKLRSLIKSMQDSILGDSVRIDTFLQSSIVYIDLMRNHIEKENYDLFPFCDTRLSERKQVELLKKFKTFENGVIGNEYYPVFHAMLEKFEEKYLKMEERKESFNEVSALRE